LSKSHFPSKKKRNKKEEEKRKRKKKVRYSKLMLLTFLKKLVTCALYLVFGRKGGLLSEAEKNISLFAIQRTKKRERRTIGTIKKSLQQVRTAST